MSSPVLNLLTSNNIFTGTNTFQGQTTFSDLIVPSVVQTGRILLNQGVLVTPAQFVLGSGWGNAASIQSVRGTDEAWTVTILSSGTGQGLNPAVAFTFSPGAWQTAPTGFSKMISGSGNAAATLDQITATIWTFTFLSVPTTGNTYTFTGMSFG